MNFRKDKQLSPHPTIIQLIGITACFIDIKAIFRMDEVVLIHVQSKQELIAAAVAVKRNLVESIGTAALVSCV